MEEIKIPHIGGLSFDQIISYIFPGFVLTLEIIIYIDILSPKHIINRLVEMTIYYPSLIALLIGLFIISMLMGIMIDGIHHLIFDSLFSYIAEKRNDYDFSKQYSFSLRNETDINIFRECVLSVHSFQEAYINLSLSLLPSFLIIPGICKRLCLPCQKIGWYLFIGLLMGIVIVFMAILSYYFLIERLDRQQEFAEQQEKEQKRK